MRFLPHYFGKHFLAGENLVYDWMHRLSPSYDGGFWEFYRLDNGGFYMAPRGEARMRIVCCEGNGYEGEVSPDAAGIIACIFALNALVCQYQNEEAFADYYDKLLDFAMEHAEARSISAAID